MLLDMIVDARRNFGHKNFWEIFILGCRAIWIHRNEATFDGVPPSVAKMEEKL
jgi:hypothetical protein